MPVGDESLPWRQKRKQTISTAQYVEQKEKIQEITTQQQAQPWTQEKVTLKKTIRDKKEVKKEKLEEVALKPTKPKEKDIQRSELEKVDLRHVTDEKEVTERVSKPQLSVDKVQHLEDATMLTVDEIEKTKSQQQATVKDWRKKRVDAQQKDTDSELLKQRQLEDSTTLHIDEVSREVVEKQLESRDWRKPKKKVEPQPEQTTDEQGVPWAKKQLKLRETSKERKEIIKEKQTIEQSLIKQQHLEDTNFIRVDERETQSAEEHGVVKDWRKPRKASVKTEEKVKPEDAVVKPDDASKPVYQAAPVEEPIPWNKQEIKLKSVTKTQKEIVKESIEDVQLKPVEKYTKPTPAVQQPTVDSTVITETKEAESVIKDWRNVRKSTQKPEQQSTTPQKHVEDTTLLTIEQRENEDVQDSLTAKDWRKPRKPSEKIEQPRQQQPQVEDTIIEEVKEVQTTDWRKSRKPTDKPQKPIQKEEAVPWNKQDIKLKSTVRDKKEISTEKLEEVQLKPIKKLEKERVEEKKEIEDSTTIDIKKKETEEKQKTKDWRKPRQPADKPVQSVAVEQKQIEDTTSLHIDEIKEQVVVVDEKIAVVQKQSRKPSAKQEQIVKVEKQQLEDTTLLRIDEAKQEDMVDQPAVKDWRKPRKTSAGPKQPSDQTQIEDQKPVQETKPEEVSTVDLKKMRKPTDQPQQAISKQEPIPWNKQEIKLKSTVKSKKETVTEKIEEMQLKPVKKDEKETTLEQEQVITYDKEEQPKDSEKPQKLSDKPLQKSKAAHKEIKATTILRTDEISKEEVVDQTTVKDWRKPRKQTDITKQTNKLEQAVAEDTTIIHIDEKEKLAVEEQVTAKDWRKPRKPIDKPEEVTKVEQKDIADTSILHTDEKVVDQTTVKDWRKSRKPTDQTKQPASETEEQIPWNKQEIKLKTTVKPKQEETGQTPLKPAEELKKEQLRTEEISKQTAADVEKPKGAATEKSQPIIVEKEIKEETPIKDWRKPRKQSQKPTDKNLKETEVTEAEQSQKSISKVKAPQEKEEEIPWNKQDIKLKPTIKNKKEQETEKIEEVPLKPVEKPEKETLHEQQQVVDKSEQAIDKPDKSTKEKKKHIEDTVLISIDETKKEEVKDQPTTKDWRKPRKPREEAAQPTDKKQDLIPTKVDDEQPVVTDESITKKDTEIKSWRRPRTTDSKKPETEATEPLVASEVQPKQVSEKPKVQEKPKVTKEKEKAVKPDAEDIKLEIKPEDAQVPTETKEDVPWTQQKIQLKRTVRDKKVTQKEGIEEVVLKPVQFKKPETEQIDSKPEESTIDKAEVVTEEETTTTVSRKKKTKRQPQEQPETVILQETVTEVEDTVVLKVDEQPQTEKTTISDDTKPEVLSKDIKQQVAPWRQKKVERQETEELEKVQLKPVQKTKKADEKEKREDVILKSVTQKEEKKEAVTVKPSPKDIVKEEISESLSSEEILPLEQSSKLAQEKESVPEQQVSSAPWRRQRKPEAEKVSDEKPALKIGKGKIPEEKENVEKVTLKPIPQKTKDVEDKQAKPETELVPVKLEDTEKDHDIPKQFTKKEVLKLTKPEADSEKEETFPDAKPTDEVEEETVPLQEMKVDIKSKKTVKKQRKPDYYDDDRPLPELEIISQKRPVQETEKAPEEEVKESKKVQEETMITKTQKKRQIQKAKPKPPKFVQRLEPVAAEKNKPTRLICKVEGSPFPEVAWYKNETLLQPSERVTVTVTEDIITLEFASVQPQDVAIYSCKAINPAGVATSTANLVILGTDFMLCDFFLCKCVLFAV